ncbi:MAG TPA: M1 family metallopeptidase [Polyangiaceae bacterium]|nr:M1 family metallopeptidase [Polyangiaceae bacterium]
MRRATQDLLIGAVFSALSALLSKALFLDTGATRAPDSGQALPAPTWPALADSPPRVASYSLEAKLDSERHRISGREKIHLLNRSNAALNELWFHLYLNAFKNDKTLFLRSPFGAGRSGDKAKEYGYVDVKRLIISGGDGRDLWPTRDRHSPDDPDDETDLRLPLPSPLEPGQTLDLELEFEDQLPELVERTGYVGSFHFVGQWFPKLARLEPNGVWSHFSFHPQSEFYADFGDYDVALDVPSAFQVGATGSKVSESRAQGRTLLRYHADAVHDFAWTAWDRFETRSELIAGTRVQVLYPPHQQRNAEAELDSVRFALPHFNARYGAYPYPNLTLVHPPEAAANAGGMEYPQLITTGGPWYSTFGGAHFIDVVTTHELGHQWFFGLLASNEHAEPFLDEGINSYAEAEALESRYGSASVYGAFGLSVSSSALNRLFSAARGEDERIAQGAADFATFRSLGALVYSRTATVLETLARVYGRQRFNHALGVYTRRFRFEHPTTADFLGVMRDELDREAAATLSLALSERGTVDYLVREISNAPLSAAAGVFDGPGGREQKKPEAPHPTLEYASRVVVYRHGSLQFPVQIELRFEDGTKQTRHWDGSGFTFNVDNVGPSPLESVNVDPEQRILLDDDRSNNWASTRDSAAPHFRERALYAAQLLLGAVGP